MVEIDELKPHEEVIEKAVAALAHEIRAEGQLRDPLMVDREDYVVLDGMHRFASLKLLKCRFAPCCLLDYNSPHIKVGAWFRMFAVNDAVALAEKLLSELDTNYSKSQMNVAAMNYDPETVILTKDGTIFSLPSSMDPLYRCRVATNIEKRMVRDGYEVTFQPETVALKQLRSDEVNFIISLPVFTKDKIRQFALEGKLLPHKVTRHIIPSRPLAIDVPLDLLTNQDISQMEADQKLVELLAKRRVDRKPPGSVVDGRHYDEELLVFSP